MFEKEAEEKYKEHLADPNYYESSEEESYLHGFQEGAEYGYNKKCEETFEMALSQIKHDRATVLEENERLRKANEWHYVKNEGTPKTEGHYLVCLRNKNKDVLDCWIYYDKDVGWYSLEVRIKDIYAWKEIVLPELKESEQ